MRNKCLALGLIGISLLLSQFENSYNVTLNNVIKTETNKVYGNGTAIYFNPETGLKCTESEAVSTTGTKTGCMKWYAFNDSANSSTLNMILDHNTTVGVTWGDYTSNTDGMTKVAEQLKADTDSWNGVSTLNQTIDNFNYTGYKARLITANEIAQITGNKNWNASASSSEKFSLSTESGSSDKTYAWLYDYTYLCNSYGCNHSDKSTYGYWTSTPYTGGNNYSWGVFYNATLSYYQYNPTGSLITSLGVRPVITIDKSKLFESVTKEDTENKIAIKAEDTSIISSNTELKVENISKESETYTELKKYITNIEKIKVYDINLYENGNKVQPNGKVILTFEIGNMDINKVKVYRMNDDKTYTKIDSKIVDNKIQIEVDHFSIYILTEEEINTDIIIYNNINNDENTNDENTNDENNNKENNDNNIDSNIGNNVEEKEENTNDEDKVLNPDTGERIFYVVDVMIIIIFTAVIVYVKLNDKNKYINLFGKK